MRATIICYARPRNRSFPRHTQASRRLRNRPSALRVRAASPFGQAELQANITISSTPPKRLGCCSRPRPSLSLRRTRAPNWHREPLRAVGLPLPQRQLPAVKRQVRERRVRFGHPAAEFCLLKQFIGHIVIVRAGSMLVNHSGVVLIQRLRNFARPIQRLHAIQPDPIPFRVDQHIHGEAVCLIRVVNVLEFAARAHRLLRNRRSRPRRPR